MASAANTKEEMDSDSGLESATASSSSLNEQEEELKRFQRVYYDLYADVLFLFNDGGEVRFNKAYLAATSDVFQNLFSQMSSGDAIEIQDFDSFSFKLFLDTLLGLHECSVLDVLMIFPIAWRFQTNKLINELVQILKPTVLNESVCLSLNLALFCKFGNLTDEIMDFLMPFRIYKILDDKNYRSLLEPESIAMLLKKIKVDSSVFYKVFEWATKYLEDKNKSLDLKSFLEDQGILNLLDLSAFETVWSLFLFNENERWKNFFDSDTILEIVKKKGCNRRKSMWFNLKRLKPYYGIVEEFLIPDVVFLEGFTTVIHITRNPVVFYDYPEEYIDRFEKQKKVSEYWTSLMENDFEDEDDEVADPDYSSEEEEETEEDSDEWSGDDEENSDEGIAIFPDFLHLRRHDEENGDDIDKESNVMIKYDITFYSEKDKKEIKSSKSRRDEITWQILSEFMEISKELEVRDNNMRDVNVKIKYKFKFNGRILMVSCDPDAKRCDGKNCMHFTSGIRVSHMKKTEDF